MSTYLDLKNLLEENGIIEDDRTKLKVVLCTETSLECISSEQDFDDEDFSDICSLVYHIYCGENLFSMQQIADVVVDAIFKCFKYPRLQNNRDLFEGNSNREIIENIRQFDLTYDVLVETCYDIAS